MDGIIVGLAIVALFAIPIIGGIWLGRSTFDGGWRERFQCQGCGHIDTFEHRVVPVCVSCGERHAYADRVIAHPVGLAGWATRGTATKSVAERMDGGVQSGIQNAWGSAHYSGSGADSSNTGGK